MYAAIIGKKLVALTNQNAKKKRSAKEFWKEIFIPLFFDEQKYLLSGGNTPLENPKISWEKKKYPTPEERTKRIEAIKKNIESGVPDTSNSLVAGSSDLEATTSGQITSFKLPLSQEEIYASWIGVGLGVRVEGGFVILFDKEEIIKLLFEGWQKYRELVNDTTNLKGNQIETWNGHWLTFALGNANYQKELFVPPFKLDKSVGKIETQGWIKVLFALARQFPNEKLNVYICSLGQTNTTVGFIQINLPEIKREIEMYDYLFGELKDVGKRAIDEVYNTQFAFRTACQNGIIGLQEIQPKTLREYFPQRKKEGTLPKIKSDEKSIINYNIYLSWVLAMLNNKTTIQAAEETAKVLQEYVATTSSRAKKTQAINVDTLLESTTRKVFIENTIDILKDNPSKSEFFNRLVEEIDKMQADKYPYFLTLVKFKYAYLNTKKS